MKSIKTTYIINRKNNKIIQTSILSQKFIKNLSESEVIELIKNENIQLFINHESDKLELISLEDKTEFINNQIINHINTEESYKDLDEFDGGYFYFAELWKNKENNKIIVLKYIH